MPYVHINVSPVMSGDEKKTLLEKIAQVLPILPGKTRDNSMVHVEDGQFLVMGDSSVPAAFVEIRVYKQSPADKKEQFAAALTELLGTQLGIPADHVYMNFMEMDHWVVNAAILQ